MNLITPESMLMFAIAIALLTTVLIALSVPFIKLYWYIQERKFAQTQYEELEIFDGYEGWIDVEDDDIPANAMVMCIGCDNMIKYDDCEPFCKECIAQSHEKPKHSEYHMDTCCIEATGVCNCDLPF